MTITRLPSGSYRIEHMEKGKRYRFTVDHKPSQKEAMILLAERMKSSVTSNGHNTSFAKAYNDYIEAKSNVLSASTIRGYDSVFRNMPEHFIKQSIYDIDNMVVQKVINEYSQNHSPKSTKNLHGLIVSVLKMVRPEMVLNTKLPQNIKKEEYIPSDEDVANILQKAKGTRYEVPLILATYGLRRGEICALTMDDLEGNVLTVNKDMVQGRGEGWIVKPTPKTDDSNRSIYLDDRTVNLIQKQGCIYDGHPELIARFLIKWQNELNIPHFSLHKLRHYFASVTHEMGISDADIMAMGGWKTDHIMKKVYRSAQEKTVSEGKARFAERMLKMSAES